MLKKDWQVIIGTDSIEVIPNNDLKPHPLSYHHILCKCQPMVEERGHKRPLIVHHSWDGREMLEEPNEHSC